ncbi:MAG: UTP--glucose-1-phosphate uridylyltransferase [Planctomycetota bacterium]
MSVSSQWPAVEAKLEQVSTPSIVTQMFRRHYECLCESVAGRFDATLRESAIEPVVTVIDAEQLDDDARSIGASKLEHVAVLKLNGGLGTSMGLEGPKSLLKVRGEDTFLTLILRQAEKLSVPLVLMNSFSTQEQTQAAINGFGSDDVQVLSFLQHQVPKIDAESLEPVAWPDDSDLEWCPPGHGDIYAALVTSGTLKKLLDEGRRYLFVSNADNLGATLDPAILGHFIQTGASFMMEVADRTLADRKGGHLAKAKDGRLVLREKAQCHPDEESVFQDIGKHRYFNTNNLWIDLQQLQDYLTANESRIDLPTITNRKTVDPKRSDSLAVYQLETAMGAAIEVLPNTTAIRVPRSRFAPVKTTNDLLAVRSDAYEVREDASVGLIETRAGQPPTIELDTRYYKTIADLEERVQAAPSLAACNQLTVLGNVHFPPGVRVEGDCRIEGSETPSELPSGTQTGTVTTGFDG